MQHQKYFLENDILEVGLGLHLCRKYIKSNGGDLKIKTGGDMISFSFTLPAEQRRPES